MGRAPLGVERPDVAEHLGESPDTLNSGFHVILEPDDAGEGRLEVRAVLADQGEHSLGTLDVMVNPGPTPLLLRIFAPAAVHGRRVVWTILSPPPEREKVLFGKDQWLFLRRDTNDVIGQGAGRVKLGRKKRNAWRQVLRRRLAMVDRTRTHWACVVIPDKEFVYSEHLPDGFRSAARRPVHEFLSIAEQVGAPATYALPALEAAKADAELFPKTDSHWNQRGAFVAYQMVSRSLQASGIRVESLNPDQIQWSEAIAPGGLGLKLYPAAVSTTTRASLGMHTSSLIFDNQVQNHGRVMIFEKEGEDGDGSCCVVFGESFVQNLLVFLKESFSRLVFVHTSMLVEEILEAEKPNVALSFPLERFLVQVPDDEAGLAGLAATAIDKAAGGELALREAPFMRDIPRRQGADDQVLQGAMPWAPGSRAESQ